MLKIFERRKKISNEEEYKPVRVKSEDRKLYILTERDSEVMKAYAEELGMKVEKVFSSIEDTKIAMLTEEDPVKLVIIEYGIGKFTHTSIREEFIDLVGMCDTDDKEVVIYYTKSVIKKHDRKSRNITWIKLNNTGDVMDDLSRT